MITRTVIYIVCGSLWIIYQDVIAATPADVQSSTCTNGQFLAEHNICDGKVDCADVSDETLARCGDVTCQSHQFRCAYGGCAHALAKCNGVTDCADSSDETEELCPRQLRVNPRVGEVPTTPRPTNTTCILPPKPAHGSYTRFIDPYTAPSNDSTFIVLNYTCRKPYRLSGKNVMICSNGVWIGKFPICKSYCKLPKNLRAIYHCPPTKGSTKRFKICDFMVPFDTIVQPVCRPNFYSPEELSPMYCVNGTWNYIPKCIPECGRMILKAQALMAGGGRAKRGELPWHAAIYTKTESPYKQICGGSIISKKVVISAAHCFWKAGAPELPCKYAVAAGKLNRAWNDDSEDYVQRRDVTDIKIPPRFRGLQTSYQDDIALVVLYKAFIFVMLVKPVCLDFDYTFDSQQLNPGNKGKVAGWGYTSETGKPSPHLKVAELPVVDIEKCINETSYDFRTYITTDKFCAGFKNGSATVCKGDSGGGLSFPAITNNIPRFYLRGIVSTSPSDDHVCNTLTITTFTRLIHHHYFVVNHFVNYTESGFQYFDATSITFYNTTEEC